MSATFRLELFVESLWTSLDLYVRVLGSQARGERPGRDGRSTSRS